MRWASPPRERRAAAVEREVVEADVEQEARGGARSRAAAPRRSCCCAPVSVSAVQWSCACAHGHARDVGDRRLPPTTHGAALGAQARAVAGVAGRLAHELRVVLAHRLGAGLAVAAHRAGEDALEAHRPSAVARVPALPHSTLTRLSPRPCSSDVALLLRRASSTACRGRPCRPSRAPRRCGRSSLRPRSIAVAHGAIAPSRIERVGSGTTSSGSTSMRVPRPLQRGHMPSGLLNEKLCGVSSGKLMPQQAARCLADTCAASSRPSTLDASARPCPRAARARRSR